MDLTFFDRNSKCVALSLLFVAIYIADSGELTHIYVLMYPCVMSRYRKRVVGILVHRFGALRLYIGSIIAMYFIYTIDWRYL